MPGEVWWAKPDPAIGREQSGRRPVVIVAGEQYLSTVTTLALAVPITTTDRGWPNHVGLDMALQQRSWAMTEQVKTISRSRLERRAGQVSFQALEEIRRWIHDYLE
ncbi:MAG: type II toxin-antitoxin system PemK/MazF family toxin [Galactobacter sp.]